MRRELYEDEHEALRASFAAFLAREVVPHHGAWEQAGIVPRAVFAQAARHGFVAMAVPEEHGGAGVDDFRFNAVLGEEAQRAGVASFGLGLTLHNDICLPYLLAYADADQRARWLRGVATGELITAIAMTEPGAGSDLASIGTRARREGDEYVVSGAKTFITNGLNADLVIVAARTDRASRHRGLTLLVLERGMERFARGPGLDKLGQHAQDTAELFFDDVRVPVANRLGAEGDGFAQLMANLPQERLSIAVAAVAAADVALAWTIEHVRSRHAFGATIGALQHTRFACAEMRTEIDVARAFVDRCVRAHVAGELDAADAAKAKWWATELQGRVVDRCLQLHGGYGYMTESPIARAWVDARVTRIYGGTTEIMKEIVGRSLALDGAPAR